MTLSIGWAIQHMEGFPMRLKLAEVIQRFKEHPASRWNTTWSQGTKTTLGYEFNYIQRSSLGQTRVNKLTPPMVREYIESWNGKPGKQTNTLSALKSIQKWAICYGLLSREFLIGVEAPKPTGQHIPWEPAEVRLAEMEARPDLARVVTLGAWTGQRKSDLVRMCWSDLEEYKGQRFFHIHQVKTGREVFIPVYPELQEAISQWERWPGPILRRGNQATGDFWTSKSLQAAWKYEQQHNDKLVSLRGLTLHGLRGHACVRLKRANMEIPMIADLVGMSHKMVERYTKQSRKLENAMAAVAFLERGKNEQHTGSKKIIG